MTRLLKKEKKKLKREKDNNRKIVVKIRKIISERNRKKERYRRENNCLRVSKKHIFYKSIIFIKKSFLKKNQVKICAQVIFNYLYYFSNKYVIYILYNCIDIYIKNYI